MNVIYGLIDPRTEELKYVGKTNDMKNRFNSHYGFDLRSKNYDKIHWIKELRDLNLRPDIFIIEENPSDWQESEKFYINYYKFIGCQLLNKTDGGDCGPVRLGEENGWAKFDNDDIKRIRQLYISGISPINIAKEYDADASTIRRIVANERYYDVNYSPNIRNRKRTRVITDEEKQLIIQLRDNGSTIRYLADRFHRNTDTIRKIIGNL